MRILYAGTPGVAATILNDLLECPHEIVGVVSQPDAPSGRGRTRRPSAVSQVAIDRGLPLLRPAHLRDPEVHREIRDLRPDVAIVVAYGQILGREELELVTHGWFNVHFSLLPAYRGAAPVQRALMDARPHSGVSIFRINEGLDSGDLAAQEPYEFGPCENASDALLSMAAQASRMLPTVLGALEAGTLELRPQDAQGVSVAPKISPRERELNPNRPAKYVRGHIRGLAAHPGAFVSIGGTRLKLLSVGQAQAPQEIQLAPGMLAVTKKHVFLGTATEPIELGMLAPSGKKPMSAAEFARGARISTGDRLDPGTTD